MLPAPPCRCIPAPLVLEDGFCFHCGRVLEGTTPAELGTAGAWGALSIAVESKREELRAEAVGAGVDLEDREEYAAWLRGEEPPTLRERRVDQALADFRVDQQLAASTA